ncbi:hypothetical protein JCGZ_19978 [Jatropha curcas]|uniref:Uncharacterized protein n=1 Tax=Jatropha curcas TaxID=180498 RepID=A0A067JV72_JATCU|nr:hypothetical protein JCGZ_19978 [Jatropha curcas]
MTSSGHSSDEDFLESLGISLDTDLTADADTHASVTELDSGRSPLLAVGCLISTESCPVTPRLETILLGQEGRPSDKRMPFYPLSTSRGHASGQADDVPHVEFILGGDYDEFCRVFLMQPIGSRLDSIQRSTPSQPLDTNSSRASGPSTRTPRRRPPTDPSSSIPVEGSSRAGPSRSTGPSRAPRAVTDATGPLHPDMANLHLPYSISYHTPDGTLAFREVSLANVNRWNLPSDSINEVPDGLVSQMMELILGMEQELSSTWTLRAFDDQRRRRPRR